MQELINVFKENNVLIVAIVILILGLMLLGYLLTSLLHSKKNKEEVKESKIKTLEQDIKEVEEPLMQEVKEDKKSLDLEEMLGKMQESLDKKDKMDEVSKYESEQEENAIISYQELLKAAKKDFPQMEDEIVEENKATEEVLKPEILEIEKPKEEKKFKNSVFISPIYGTKGSYAKEEANESLVDLSINKDNLEYENEVNEQFLDDLKKFRSNL